MIVYLSALQPRVVWTLREDFKKGFKKTSELVLNSSCQFHQTLAKSELRIAKNRRQMAASQFADFCKAPMSPTNFVMADLRKNRDHRF